VLLNLLLIVGVLSITAVLPLRNIEGLQHEFLDGAAELMRGQRLHLLQHGRMGLEIGTSWAVDAVKDETFAASTRDFCKLGKLRKHDVPLEQPSCLLVTDLIGFTEPLDPVLEFEVVREVEYLLLFPLHFDFRLALLTLVCFHNNKK